MGNALRIRWYVLRDYPLHSELRASDEIGFPKKSYSIGRGERILRDRLCIHPGSRYEVVATILKLVLLFG